MRLLLAVLVSVVVGAGGAVGIMIWEPWENNGGGEQRANPTPDEPRLTEQEAIGLVVAGCRNAAPSAYISDEATAYYRGNGKWTVKCPRRTSETGTDSWTIDETTNTAIPLGTNVIEYDCHDEP